MKTDWNNPLLKNETAYVDLQKGDVRTHISKSAQGRSKYLDLKRKKTAAIALASFDRNTEIFGLTKGQFSQIDALVHLVKSIGGCTSMDISTWSAAKTDVYQLMDLRDQGMLKSCRWLVDYTFQKRKAETAAKIRRHFGYESIRVAKNHAKFCLIDAPEWKIVYTTSANLNHNPRFEHFTVKHDPALFAFIQSHINEVWDKQDRLMAFRSDKQCEIHFRDDL